MENLVKISDAIAELLKEREIRHVFGIIGSANSHIFDSITNLGYTQIICVHHEQAATMAMQTYYRISGKITAAILTAGGGSINGVTGVLGAWADSIPGIIISGQENTRHIDSMKDMRMWGIQGYDSTDMVKKITKYSVRVMEPENVIKELEKSFFIAGSDRPGPAWIDLPMDVQGAKIPKKELQKFTPEQNDVLTVSDDNLKKIYNLVANSKKPVLWLGHGIRLSGAEKKIKKLLEVLPFPVIVSWAGMDLLEDSHPLNYGRAGVYGTRAANLIIQNSDLVISIGNRMSILMIGYEQSEFARDAKIIQVDIDSLELEKTEEMVSMSINSDAGMFIKKIIDSSKELQLRHEDINEWLNLCKGYKDRYPLIGPEHADKENYINSYSVINKLSDHLKEEEIIVTDMGTGLLSGHQAIKLKEGQRLMTSTGLGEMGYGLPGAIGASFAREKGEVVCLNCDGGMMMNLQELQTIVHHQLPIKIFIFNNDGYLMIKHTQKNLFEGRYSGTDNKSGVSCPDFSKIAFGFGLEYRSIKTWEDFDRVLPELQKYSGPIICDIFMHPEQLFHPKLSVAVRKDGTLVSPPLEDLSPLLDRDVLNKEMIIGLHEKSKNLD